VITHNSKRYKTLVGCLFDRQKKHEHTTSPLNTHAGLIIITDIVEAPTAGRYLVTARLISTMLELNFDFNTGDLEMFLNLKSGNNSKYDFRESFTYKYRYIQ